MITIKTIVVKTKEELRKIIEQSPIDANLNHLDVSEITDSVKRPIGPSFQKE